MMNIEELLRRWPAVCVENGNIVSQPIVCLHETALINFVDAHGFI